MWRQSGISLVARATAVTATAAPGTTGVRALGSMHTSRGNHSLPTSLCMQHRCSQPIQQAAATLPRAMAPTLAPLLTPLPATRLTLTRTAGAGVRRVASSGARTGAHLAAGVVVLTATPTVGPTHAAEATKLAQDSSRQAARAMPILSTLHIQDAPEARRTPMDIRRTLVLTAVVVVVGRIRRTLAHMEAAGVTRTLILDEDRQ
eukprot:Rmarinus@m.26594